jgi:hypothetical protein
MDRTFKSVVVLLMLAALPIQGYAAATKIFCLPETQRSQSASSHYSHHGGVAEHRSDDPHQAIAQSQLAQQEHANYHDHGFKHGSSNCSVSAPCCVGGTIVSSAPIVALLPRANVAPIALASSTFSTRTIDGLDRPPRLTLL